MSGIDLILIVPSRLAEFASPIFAQFIEIPTLKVIFITVWILLLFLAAVKIIEYLWRRLGQWNEEVQAAITLLFVYVGVGALAAALLTRSTMRRVDSATSCQRMTDFECLPPTIDFRIFIGFMFCGFLVWLYLILQAWWKSRHSS